jgi:hypothetical protein
MFVFNKFYNKHQNVEPGRTRGDDNYGAVQEQETLESRRAAARTQYIILYTYCTRLGAHYAGAGALSASEDKNTRAATRKKQTQHWSTQYI